MQKGYLKVVLILLGRCSGATDHLTNSIVTTDKGGWKSSNLKNTKVLLGCELAGSKPQAAYGGIYVITDATKLAVRYVFLLPSNARIPAAKDVRLPMGSVFQRLRSGTS